MCQKKLVKFIIPWNMASSANLIQVKGENIWVPITENSRLGHIALGNWEERVREDGP